MKYENNVVQDGVTYMAGEDVPDMGSIICTKFSGNIRSYEGLQKDIASFLHMLQQVAPA